jgi:hypothetical protein
MDHPFIVDGRADVARIMQRLRDRISSRRERTLTEGRLDDAVKLRLQEMVDEAELDSELLARLLAPGKGWNISIDYRVQSHRRGLSRHLVLLLKALVRPVVRLYTDQILARQAQLNAYLVHTCHRLVRDLVRVEAEGSALRARCESLERRLQELERSAAR